MKRIISFVLSLVFSLFLSVSNTFADEIGSELNNDLFNESKPNNIKINKNNNNNNKSDIPNASNKDIFGDEQAFPFIAGLGKNAAH